MEPSSTIPAFTLDLINCNFARAQDIRSFDRDTVDMSKCFGPGDIIKAEVISLGDAYSYYLSTAKNDLGVVFAESAGGDQLVPVSWDQMQHPKSGMIEFKKCAKPHK
eukprot:Partr_v1_DN28810_c2_g1_i1_m34266 putative exosome component 1